jgi:ATP-dependent Clp protease ATP-binding subunit ClpA
MDYATITDNSGKKADFRNVILIMTSNAGARDIGKPLIGFGDQAVGKAAIGDAVERIFSPEFRNRLDKIVVFGNLDRPVVRDIVLKEIAAFSLQLAEKNVTLDIDDAAVDYLLDLGFSREFGARNVARVVEEKVKDRFIEEVLFGNLSGGGSAKITIRDGEIRIETVPASAPSRDA